MSRNVTGAFTTAAEAPHVEGVHLVEFYLTAGTFYVTDCGYNLQWNGNTYLGAGAFAGIDELKETTSGEIVGIQLILAGPVSAFVAEALQTRTHGRMVIVRVAFLDNGVIVNAPAEEFRGVMGPMAVTDAPGENGDIESQIVVTAETRRVGSRRARRLLHAVEEHALIHPGDTIHRFIPAMKNREVVWPAAAYWRR